MSGAAASPSITIAQALAAIRAAALAGARAIPPRRRAQVPSRPVPQPWLDLRAPRAHEAINTANRASDVIRHHARRATPPIRKGWVERREPSRQGSAWGRIRP